MGNLFYNLLFSFLRFLDGAKKKCRSYLILRSPNNFKYIIDDKKITTIIRNKTNYLYIDYLCNVYTEISSAYVDMKINIFILSVLFRKIISLKRFIFIAR